MADIAPVKDRAWLSECEYKLVTKMSEWEAWKVDAGDTVVLDLETTGLNPYKHMIVGVSLSKRESEAIYVPLRHPSNNYEDVAGFIDELSLFFDGRTLLAYNAKFDINFLETAGMKIPKYEDVMTSVYLMDCNLKAKGLKDMAKLILGIDMIRLDELFLTPEELAKKTRRKKDMDFSTISPDGKTKDYACSDADLTLRIHNHLESVREEQAIIYKMETKLVDVVRRMERNGVLLDADYLARLVPEADKNAQKCQKIIYDAVGYEFNLGSPKQVGPALEGLGFEVGRTEKGNPKTGKAELKRLGDHAVPKAILKYREMVKAKGTYLVQLYHDAMQGRARFRFNQFAAPSGRFSSGKDKDSDIKVKRDADDGYAKVNVQSISSNASAEWVHGVEILERTTKEDPETVLYKKTVLEIKEDLVEA